MSLIVTGATIIDGVAEKPIAGSAIWIEAGRIRAIGPERDLGAPSTVERMDARGKYVIPGLMNANVHLLIDIRLENLARYMGRFEDLIIETAQIALKAGLTTVFDTWGPRRFLMSVRDKINAGEIQGSRLFCAGNIIGFDGPLSADFMPKAAEVASADFKRRINSIWAENVGRHLMWLTPSQVAKHVRDYIGRGIDFVKYGSNEHYLASAGAFLAFSPTVQAAIVEEAHRAGITAQAHTESVEGLRIAVDAGCDIIQHANMTGPVPIPEDTLELMARRKTGAVVFPNTHARLEWIKVTENRGAAVWETMDVNARNLIRSGATLLLANDGGVYAPEMLTDPITSKWWMAPGEDNLNDLSTGHFVWFRAMEEKGCSAMEMLRAATINIARTYGKDRDLGTLEPGKIADLLILDRNPMDAAKNFQSIRTVIKDGAIVDRDSLPQKPLVSLPLGPPEEEEASFIPFLAGSTAFPGCPSCIHEHD